MQCGCFEQLQRSHRRRIIAIQEKNAKQKYRSSATIKLQIAVILSGLGCVSSQNIFCANITVYHGLLDQDVSILHFHDFSSKSPGGNARSSYIDFLRQCS